MLPALAASFGFAVLPITWGRWPDVLVDFGQQLYVPWRLASGDVLYRDVAYLHGPLSQYLNALLFRVFGTGFWTLAIFNLATTALATWLLWRLFARLGGALSATVTALSFLAVFAFGQPLAIGNYNWVTPYVHEITHGALLALGGLLALARLDETGRARSAAVAGFLLGLTFLTKAEVFAAAAVADVVYVAVLTRETRRRALAPFLLAASSPPLLAFLLFATALPSRDALLAALGPFRPRVLLGGAAENVFFLSKMGLTDPAACLQGTGVALLVYAAVLGPVYVAARRVPKAAARPAAAAAALFAAAALALAVRFLPALAFSLPFPLAALAVLLVAAARLRRGAGPRERLRLAFAAFALALLPKMLLLCVVVHYGFVLAMPATLLAIDAAVSLVPSHVAARGGAPGVFRAAALVTAGAIAAVMLAISALDESAKTVPVGAGRDAFLADARGLYVDAALAELQRLRKPGETFAAVPEGAMLSYLARLPNPTPYTNLMPPEVTSFGEEAILAAFRAHPPDLVAVVHKSTAEYGLPFFGKDYARGLGGFLRDRYETVSRLGAAPLVDERFGIDILRRKETRGPR